MTSPLPTARSLFQEALDLPSAAARTAFLDQACQHSPELRTAVEALLTAYQSAGSFLESPAADLQPIWSENRTTDRASDTDCGVAPPGHLPLDFLLPPREPGHLGRLAHYEVLEIIGRGGMGVVLKAIDENLQRVVAIKVLAPHLAMSGSARQRFVREARAAAAVRNDHVVSIYAVEEPQGLPYLVMECIAGTTLQELLDASGALPTTEILRIGMQVAAGLTAAHAQGLIHRDIKPANILLENGVQRVKITDFGLARVADDVSLTQSGLLAGTPQYMSPEQAQGLPLDARSDLFSLGCVLYALCTGKPPFRAETTLATVRRVCEDTPHSIRDINPEVPQWLVEIVDRLLAKQPAERFQSAQEVADLLSQRLAELQQSTLPIVVTKPRGKSDPRRERAWRSSAPFHPRLLVAVAALALLGITLSLTEAGGVTHLAATIIRIFTPEGTLVVEVDDPAVKVTLEGEGDLVISGAGPHEVRLKPGSYRWKATRDGQVVKQELVEITRGGKRTVRVTREETGQTLARRTATAIPETKAPAEVPLDPGRPFVVLSPAGAVKRQLAGLQTAISEAASGDIIEIRGDGPYLTPPSSAAGKALTIRAGVGFRPVLKLDLGQVGPEARVTMLRTTAPLVVEGIEFHVYRSGLLPPPKINSPLGQCTGLQADAASLRVANCRFLGLGNVLAIDAHYTPDLEIRNSLLLGGITALFASLRGPAQVRVENNLILADTSPLRLHVDGRQPDQTSVSIRRNTLLGYYAIAWLVHEWETSLEAQSKSATKLSRCEVAENLLCSYGTQALFNACFDSERPVKSRYPNPDELQQALRTLIEWNERNNGYSDHPLSSGQLVSTSDTSGKMYPLATTLADWNAFWGLKDTGSAVGAVRFIDGDVQQLLRSSKESLLPASFLLKNDSFGYRADKNQPNLGADVSLVGPGTAYERWQATPAYEEWRHTTNQTGQARAESRRSTNQAAAATPREPAGRAAETGAFVVLGGKAFEQKFDTLAEAVLKSGDGDTIEIRGNGPFTIEPIRLKSRRVIRAGTGFRPVLKLNAPPTDVRPMASRLESIAPLILEGLEFQSAPSDIRRATVMTLTDEYGSVPALYVANCRFVRCGVMPQNASGCQVRNSEVESISLINNKAPFSAVIDNNICLQRVSMVASGKGGFSGPQELVLTRNALGGDLTLSYYIQGNPAGDEAKAFSVKSSQNVWFGRSAAVRFSVSSRSPSPTEEIPGDKAEALLRRVCGWSPQHNVYPEGVSLLSLAHYPTATTIRVIEPTRSYKSLEEWNQLWDVKDATSLQGTIRCQGGDVLQKLSAAREKVVPEDFRLLEGSPGYRAGPDGKDLGPDVDLVGPGAAYERWKKTPEYQQWLKDTDQLRAETSQPEAGAFVILSGSPAAERKFDTLAEAVEKSSNGDTIEIRGNGPFVIPQLQISTALTIRAGAGCRPVIQATRDVESARPPHFVVARGPLTLEGLEFQGPATGGSDCMLIVQDAPCYVANCQFRRCSLTVSRALGYQVRNSHFSTTRTSSLIVASAVPPGPTQVVDNNLITNLLSASGPGARIDIRRNLIMGTQGSVAVAAANPNREQLPVGLHLSRNIIVGSPVLRFSEAATVPYRTTAASGAELEAVLRTVVHWREDRNLYSEGAQFLDLRCATGRTSGGGYVFDSVEPSRPYRTLLDWNEFWGQSDTGAIQGRVQFQGGDAALAAPFTLQPDDFCLRSDSAGYRAGPDGKDLGPDIDLVGPGAAYERWQKTPEYQKWLEETGQKK